MVRIRSIVQSAVIAITALPIAASAQTFKVDKFDIGGTGRFDYVSADGTGRVFVSRSNHMMVIDGATGKVLGDIPDTPGIHGAAFAPKSNHGFTTNSGDSTLTMFDLKTLAVIKKVPAGINGLDGIMYDDGSDRIVTSNHSGARGSPGTLTFVDAKSGDVIGNVQLGGVPEGVASDGKGTLYVNLEDKNAIQVVDEKAMTAGAIWPIAPCESPTGIAMDRANNRIFSGCGKTSVVLDAKSGKVVAQIANGDGVDALGFDAAQKLMYIPGSDATVTIVHQDSPDKYSVVATVTTMRGARTIGVDATAHRAYAFTPEYGPAPAPDPNAPPPAGRGRGPQGPMVGAWLFAISH